MRVITLLILIVLGNVLMAAPGVVVSHTDADSGLFLATPGIVAIDKNMYIAKCDISGKDASNKTIIFRSEDSGKSWTKISEADCCRANIFIHRSKLYMIGTSGRYGDVVVVCSDDNGRSWTTSKDADSGLILKGQYHTSPTPIVYSNGRVWKAVEDTLGLPGLESNLRSFMLSAPTDRDLLKASNWSYSNRIAADADWLSGRFVGWIAGNAAVSQENAVVNILSLQAKGDSSGKAAIIRYDRNGRIGVFDPKADFFNLPGAENQFSVKYDAQSKTYWTISNVALPANKANGNQLRNSAILLQSENLTDWQIKTVLLCDMDTQKKGLEYIDWAIEDDDIIAISATSSAQGNGDTDLANANSITFHRFENFRKLKMENSAEGAEPGQEGWAGQDWQSFIKPNQQLDVANEPKVYLGELKDLSVAPNKTVWLTTYFKAPENWFSKNVWISAGIIDEIDDTYVNGVLVGSRGRGETAWGVMRVYEIPNTIVLSGKWNKVSIRVTNVDGAGGVSELPSMLTIAEEITLDGKWMISDIDDTANASTGYYRETEKEALDYLKASGISRTTHAIE